MTNGLNKNFKTGAISNDKETRCKVNVYSKGTIMAKYDPVPFGDKISDVGRTCWSKFNHELRKLEAQ